MGDTVLSRRSAQRSGLDIDHQYHRPASHPTNEERVYFTSDLEFARAWATNTRMIDVTSGTLVHQGDVYEVEPVGPVEPDPDFPLTTAAGCAAAAMIVRVVERDVALSLHEAARRLAPYLRWTDGTPLYDGKGRYIPSPEQKAANFHHPSFEYHYPWTPLEHFNSWIAGESSNDRPRISDHPGISLEAHQANDVMRRHMHDAQRMLDAGIRFERFSSAEHDPLEINDLFGDLYTFDPGKHDAAVALAIDRHDAIAAAIAMTAYAARSRTTVMISTIRVAEPWQRRRLGSVLMTAAQQIIPNPVYFAAGKVDHATAPFFAQLGFTVLKPEVPLLLPAATGIQPIALSDQGENWFYRHGPI